MRRALSFLLPFWIILALTIIPRSSPAETVRYRIDAVVDYATPGWGIDGCGLEVGVPGTLLQIDLALDYDTLQYEDPTCSINGCSQNITDFVYKIRFSGNDACTIDSSTRLTDDPIYGWDYSVATINDYSTFYPFNPFDSFTINSDINNFTCSPGYEPFTGPPLCRWSVGDPSNSSQVLYFKIFIQLKELSGTKFNQFVLPADLGFLDADPQFDAGQIKIKTWDAVSLGELIIQASFVDIQIIAEDDLIPKDHLILPLIEAMAEINAPNSIVNSLYAKLDSALEVLEDGNVKNDGAAINKLQAFINSLEAQRSKHIPDAEVDALIAEAQNIIDMLSMK